MTDKMIPVPDVDRLSNIIREADGKNDLGAGALAEKIVKALLREAAQPDPISELLADMQPPDADMRRATDAAIKQMYDEAPTIPSPADEELRRERVRQALDAEGFSLQDDYYLANGASLMSEDSHQIIHRDVVDAIVCAAIDAALAADKREGS